MKRFLSLFLTCILLQSAFYFVLLPANAAAQKAGEIVKQETLNNESIIEMLNAGLSETIMIAKIKSSRVNFDTSSTALQSLKKQGITDTVILAMVQKASGMEITPSNTSTGDRNNTLGSSAQTMGTGIQTPTAPLTFGLQDGTPVKLRIGRTMSSAEAKTGETVDFEVLEDVKIGDNIVIPRGGIALGTVTQGKPKGRMGKGGKLDINIDSVRLVSGEKVALRAVKETKGGSHTGAMTGAIVATSILFFPAAPFFLFMKGKDITIPKGTEITAYINGDIPLDSSKFNIVLK